MEWMLIDFLVAVFWVTLFYQLRVGKLYGRNFEVYVTLEDNPRSFWFHFVCHFVVLVFMTYVVVHAYYHPSLRHSRGY
jgi:hypothetical protein